MLRELREQYHRIRMLKDIYPTARMREYTVVLYRLGIGFLFEAVRYYSRGTFRKLQYVIARPPSIELEDKVAEIKTAIIEIEREMRALNGIRLSGVERVQNKMEKAQREDKETLCEVKAVVQCKSADTTRINPRA